MFFFNNWCRKDAYDREKKVINDAVAELNGRVLKYKERESSLDVKMRALQEIEALLFTFSQQGSISDPEEGIIIDTSIMVFLIIGYEIIEILCAAIKKYTETPLEAVTVVNRKTQERIESKLPAQQAKNERGRLLQVRPNQSHQVIAAGSLNQNVSYGESFRNGQYQHPPPPPVYSSKNEYHGPAMYQARRVGAPLAPIVIRNDNYA